MPIRVTCRGCHTRFNVSERFAGKEGPCPKCKAIIRIPAASEEVVIHGPAAEVTKDSRGTAITKPIFRQEAEITPLTWTIVHPIDEGSPLARVTPEWLDESEAEILVLLSGIDETHEQTVHTRSSYLAREIVWNARFQSIYVDSTANGPIVADIGRLDELERT